MGLGANSFYYEALLKELHRLHDRNDPRTLEFLEHVANFAWTHHPGRFADGALENIAFRRGLELFKPPGDGHIGPRHAEDLSRTLHVASSVYSSGGHSRVLTKWIQRDLSS